MKSFSSLLCCLLLAVSAAGCWVPELPDDTVFSCDTNADCAEEGVVCMPRAGLRGFCCRADTEVCNGVDDNCNGVKDDLSGEPCYTGPEGTLGKGACEAGKPACGANGQVICTGEVKPTSELCNGKDDDCDGVPDEEEFDLLTDMANCGECGKACNAVSETCASGACQRRSELDCGNGVDDDGDGNKDCADLLDCDKKSCGAACTCVNGRPGEGACGDGQDNDKDGDIDCVDFDCLNQSCGTGCVCSSSYIKTETDCGDGQDNDKDGKIDCADTVDCGSQSCGTNCQCQGGRAVETSCSDGQDNDKDGKADCADTVDCPEFTNRGNGTMCAGGNAVEVACSDKADNDGNGATDCTSGKVDANCNNGVCGAGCSFVSCTKKETVCNDNLDNDGDTGVDCADSVDCPTNAVCRRPNGTAGKCLANKTCG
ncbi:MopE-related protein [Archangium lipolyticum]|uniref:MopE-related protein n=1 Tax=Archangium lipolyticum TaxID=2970465 RepID=UPI00214A8685|nr:MopE-related protein [Archangium lipolyticum]